MLAETARQIFQIVRPLPQLYSRTGFATNAGLLTTRHPRGAGLYAQHLGLTFDPSVPDDAEAAGTITRITGRNFRLMTQAARVLDINQLETSGVIRHALQLVGTQVTDLSGRTPRWGTSRPTLTVAQ